MRNGGYVSCFGGFPGPLNPTLPLTQTEAGTPPEPHPTSDRLEISHVGATFPILVVPKPFK